MLWGGVGWCEAVRDVVREREREREAVEGEGEGGG
jgi:hypothetical protein